MSNNAFELFELYLSKKTDTYIIPTIGECCVCYEPTYYKTECGHSICPDCWMQMNNHCIEKYQNDLCRKATYKLNCPMCRETVNRVYFDECEDSTDCLHYTNYTIRRLQKIADDILKSNKCESDKIKDLIIFEKVTTLQMTINKAILQKSDGSYIQLYRYSYNSYLNMV